MKLGFLENKKPLTLGVELEFQVLDKQTLQLTPQASELIKKTNSPKIIHEFFQSTIEIVSGVCNNVFEVSGDLAASATHLTQAGDSLGLCFASTGTHPQADYRERLVTDSPRYGELIDRNQWLIRRMAVYGMHIHLGMKSGDDCIRFHNFFLYFVPHLLALSASSPYWQKMDTGLASCRPTMYEALPTAGIPYIVRTWNEFEKLIRFLKRSDAIQSIKDLWWDIRPSPALGTLEIRVCDGPATQKEMAALVAFVHTLALWFQDHQNDWTKTHAPIKRWIFRENKWRAIRYGLDASIIITKTGKTRPLRQDIENWLDDLDPYSKSLNYQESLKMISTIMDKGNSAQRQRKVFERTRDLGDVARHNIQEFNLGEPIWP
jgi:carboxylate-amine ligase